MPFSFVVWMLKKCNNMLLYYRIINDLRGKYLNKNF